MAMALERIKSQRITVKPFLFYVGRLNAARLGGAMALSKSCFSPPKPLVSKKELRRCGIISWIRNGMYPVAGAQPQTPIHLGTVFQVEIKVWDAGTGHQRLARAQIEKGIGVKS